MLVGELGERVVQVSHRILVDLGARYEGAVDRLMAKYLTVFGRLAVRVRDLGNRVPEHATQARLLLDFPQRAILVPLARYRLAFENVQSS